MTPYIPNVGYVPGKVVPVQLDEEKVREIIKEEMEKLRDGIVQDMLRALNG